MEYQVHFKANADTDLQWYGEMNFPSFDLALNEAHYLHDAEQFHVIYVVNERGFVSCSFHGHETKLLKSAVMDFEELLDEA